MRETARIWKLNRKTVTRKMLHMGERTQIKLEQLNKKRNKSIIVELDDLETFEHTKCKELIP